MARIFDDLHQIFDIGFFVAANNDAGQLGGVFELTALVQLPDFYCLSPKFTGPVMAAQRLV